MTGALGGAAGAANAETDLPEEVVGAEVGSGQYIAPWIPETFVNELLAAPVACHRPYSGIDDSKRRA